MDYQPDGCAFLYADVMTLVYFAEVLGKAESSAALGQSTGQESQQSGFAIGRS